MKRVVFVGSFSPVHNGHMDIINRLVNLFDEVILAVTQNKNKVSNLTVLQREELLKLACEHFSNVKVMTFDGVLTDFCKENDVDCIIKAVRNTVDFEYEYSMATINKEMFGVETMIMFSSPKFRSISSSLVREFLLYGKDITTLVPECIVEKIKEVFHVS